MNFALKLAGHK